MLGEVEDRITHELAWTMIGDVSAAVGVENLRAARGKKFLGHQHVFLLRIPAQGVDVWMFQQDQRIGNCSGFALRHPLPLQLQRRSVIHKPVLFEMAKHGKKVSGTRCQVSAQSLKGKV